MRTELPPPPDRIKISIPFNGMKHTFHFNQNEASFHHKTQCICKQSWLEAHMSERQYQSWGFMHKTLHRFHQNVCVHKKSCLGFFFLELLS